MCVNRCTYASAFAVDHVDEELFPQNLAMLLHASTWFQLFSAPIVSRVGCHKNTQPIRTRVLK